MKSSLMQYQTLVFDCDGVVLNSNKIKTQAFYDAAKSYGHEPAQALLNYHVLNGGISRYKKFEYFFTDILNIPVDQSGLDELLTCFANEVKKALLTCEVADGLYELREKTKHATWCIVSGGDQTELREVFAKIGLDKLFDGGIFGSPDTKDEILSREMAAKNISSNALFLGDSKYDFMAATTAGLDFIFLSDWSEVVNWQTWALEHGLQVESNIIEL